MITTDFKLWEFDQNNKKLPHHCFVDYDLLNRIQGLFHGYLLDNKVNVDGITYLAEESKIFHNYDDVIEYLSSLTGKVYLYWCYYSGSFPIYADALTFKTLDKPVIAPGHWKIRLINVKE